MRNDPTYFNQYYKANRKAIIARTSAYHKTDAGKAAVKRANATYCAAHPEKVKQMQRAADRTINGRYSVGKACAKRTGRIWALSLPQYAAIVSAGTCYYCTGPLPETGHGLDRVDNARGYETGNVLPCCGECNQHRSNTWTVEETRVAVQAVIQLRKEA
jgi:hypothetical protein